LSVRVRVKALPRIERVATMYREVARQYHDFRPAWTALKPEFAANVLQAILTEGASIGAPWAPLSEGYARRKAQEGHGREAYVRSGRLIGEQRALAAGWSARATSASYYSKVRYSYALQRGGGKTRYPGRRFIGYSQQLEQKTRDGIEKRADAIIAEAVERMRARGEDPGV